MPYDLHIIKTKDFIRFDGHGHVAVDESHRVLANLAKTCVERGIDCALLDIRDIRSKLPLADVYRLARAFQEMGFQKHHRLAILHRYDASERAALFAMLASARGWNVRAFDEYEDAIQWFAEERLIT